MTDAKVPASTRRGLQALAVAWALVAVGLPFIPWASQRFWSLEYRLFLAALAAAPLLLVWRHGWRARRGVLLASLAFFGFLQWACPRPSGATELLVLGLLDGKPVLAHALKLGLLFGLAVPFARYYCGWLCPKGALQELVRDRRLTWRVPPRIDRILKWGKYLAAAALLAAPLFWDARLFKELGPFKVVFNLGGEWWQVALLVVVLVSSLFIERAFCRYLCPVGGLLALVARWSPFSMRVEASVCTGCGRCQRACPVDAIQVAPGGTARIDRAECLSCRDCEQACPRGAIGFAPASSLLQPSTPTAREGKENAA